MVELSGYKVSRAIEKLNKELGIFRRDIHPKTCVYVEAMKKYRKQYAKTLAELGANESYTMGDKAYKTPPVSVREKIADGICADEWAEMEIARSDFRSSQANLDALTAELSGFQSIFRHMDSM